MSRLNINTFVSYTIISVIIIFLLVVFNFVYTLRNFNSTSKILFILPDGFNGPVYLVDTPDVDLDDEKYRDYDAVFIVDFEGRAYGPADAFQNWHKAYAVTSSGDVIGTHTDDHFSTPDDALVLHAYAPEDLLYYVERSLPIPDYWVRTYGEWIQSLER
ncbi:hypothetical protein [Mucisphaera sp.]|uniref:hypothetical protein n=1 Tax=Mucisphaera sp. TaxID=2913024 RepID=UPI003D0F0224